MCALFVLVGSVLTMRWLSAAGFSTYTVASGSSAQVAAIQKGTRVLISLWDSLMFGAGTRYPPEH